MEKAVGWLLVSDWVSVFKKLFLSSGIFQLNNSTIYREWFEKIYIYPEAKFYKIISC